MQPSNPNTNHNFFDPQVVKSVKAEVEKSKSCLVLLPPDPSSDQIGSGLALFLALQESGKQAQIGCGTPIKVENTNFFGVDKIKTSVGNQNLVITLDFKEENLKKVDYDVDEEGHFMLLIQPQDGIEPPDSSTVRFNYSGASAELVFVIGVNSLEELGRIYADEKAFLDNANIVSLNQNHKPGGLGNFQLHLTGGSSLAEGISYLLRSWKLNLNEDIAENLLTVISDTTDQFSSPKVTADTFEMVAFLMRNGAKLNRSPLATSSRFGAFPPSPFGPPLTPPTFDDDYEPTPFPKVRPDWKKPKIFKSLPPRPVDISSR